MMRFVLPLLLALSAAGQNLLSNPGFESWTSDTLPDGWRVAAAVAVRRDADTVCFGVAACRVESRGAAGGPEQSVAVRPGASYRYRLRLWHDDDRARAAVVVSWFRDDSSFIRSERPVEWLRRRGWQTLEAAVRAPAGAARAAFQVRLDGPAGARVLADECWFGLDGTEPAKLEVFFARDSLCERLVEFIGGAKKSLDYCHYNSSRPEVVAALLAAHGRGVKLRVITDNTRLDNEWVAALRAAGVPVWTDSIGPGPNNLMHNKFCVRDDRDADTTDDFTWTASYNPNDGELRADCALQVPHAGIARAYLAEFEQMWGGAGDLPDPSRARFHGGKLDVQARHDFTLEGNPCRVYFAPQDRVSERITEVAAAARRHLLFAVFAYTWDPLGDAMIALWNRGGWCGGVYDKSGAYGQGSEFERLVNAGLEVYVDSVSFGERIVHEKLMVVDSLVTVAGSANWSQNANTGNDESTIILEHPDVARLVLAELRERFREVPGTGIAEPTSGFGLVRGLRLALARDLARLAEAGALVFEATGRRLEPGARPAPGVYIVRDAGGARQVLIVR
ncbi:hypothetical protein JXB37_02230 [candidate division WOR-3 bacterium]|nr:hypothetical protein [candidate division WOR-3 bacterium]